MGPAPAQRPDTDGSGGRSPYPVFVGLVVVALVVFALAREQLPSPLGWVGVGVGIALLWAASVWLVSRRRD